MSDSLVIVASSTGTTIVTQPGTAGPAGSGGAAGTDATYSDATPEALGTAAAGVAAEASRGDHVHAMPSAADVGAAATSHTHALADVTDAGGAAALEVGTGAGTVAAGDDSRLSDARTPTAHTHTLSEVTDSGTAAALDVPATGDAASGQVVKGDDTRLSDARTPSSTLAHAASHADGGSDELDVADLASGAATVGQAPLADGAGGVAWGDVAAGGGAVDSVNGYTGTVVLTNTDVGAAATSHTHGAADVSDSTTTGRAVVTATDAAAARTAIGAGTSSFDGAYSSLSGTPTLGTAAALDVPATGDAAAGEVVKGSDTRLSDSRTPTTHSHTLADVTDSGGAAALNVGTTAGTVAAGDDSRIVLGGTSVQPGDDAADLGSGTATGGHVLTADGAGGTSFAAASGGGSGIAETLIDAKGDLIAGSAADTAARLAVGANDTVLMAASGEATGLKYGPTAQTYTPTLTASTTDPTLGSGAIQEGRYYRVGNLVFVFISITFGTSPSAGSGTYYISAPVTPYASAAGFNSAGAYMGSGTLRDESTALHKNIGCMWSTTVDKVFMRLSHDSSGGVVNNSTYSWAAGDTINMHLVYEAA